MAAGLLRPVLQLGLPDRFIEHGDPAKLLALQGLDAAGIEASVRARFGAIVASGARPGLKVVA
jgi:1-deoxy-D-xylulose-5-phosphate synthase